MGLWEVFILKWKLISISKEAVCLELKNPTQIERQSIEFAISLDNTKAVAAIHTTQKRFTEANAPFLIKSSNTSRGSLINLILNGYPKLISGREARR